MLCCWRAAGVLYDDGVINREACLYNRVRCSFISSYYIGDEDNSEEVFGCEKKKLLECRKTLLSRLFTESISVVWKPRRLGGSVGEDGWNSGISFAL